MISARSLLKDSIRVLYKNPLLFFYGLIYFLPVVVAVIASFLLAISAGTLSLITFSIPVIVSGIFGMLFGSFIALFFTAVSFFFIAVVSLAFTLYIQAILRGTHASVYRSLKKSFDICGSVIWVSPAYLLYYFISAMHPLMWVIAFTFFCYIPQLVADGETSLISTFKQSFWYVSATCFVIIKFIILLLSSWIALWAAMLFLAILGATFAFIPAMSFFFAACALIAAFGAFIFAITWYLIFLVGINKLYLVVRT